MGLSNKFIKEILISKISNELTKQTYITRIDKLSEHLKVSIYEILKDPKKYYHLITQPYKTPCSIRNNVNLILSIFKYIPNLIRKKPNTYHDWKKKLESIDITPIKIDIPITKEMIIQKYHELKKSNQHVLGLTQSMQYLLLSLLVNVKVDKPQYNDLAVVFGKVSQSPNYILIKNNNGFMKLNDKNYKLNNDLVSDIMDSLKYHPRIYVFGFLKLNSYNVFFIRTFEKLFNHKVGVNNINHLI
jgi:hypothetical protein